ncbi:MAG TPA: dTDP-4-dehydrorhamnose 3,5-epimerase [Rhabdochlamydiaceae bacterium]|nr:dTDP-4-dehydrorhamnose 3,5-epimerase [Rhabdochlamydiaceae bacterium]
MLQISPLSLEGPKLIKISPFFDERGFFQEWYRKPLYQKWGVASDFVQDNHSYSKKNVLRGMHFQRKPGQAKLVTVLRGSILDVFVDIRPHSPTFGKWESIVLDAAQHQQLFIPIGFAHGFLVLSEEAHVFYKISSVYDPAEEKTFRFDDPTIGIDWPVKNPLISPRDLEAPYFSEVVTC